MNYLDFGITKLDTPINHTAAGVAETGSHLIDTTTKTFLMSALQKAHETRMKYYSIVFNFVVFIGFILVFGGALYYCYLAKRSPEEQNYKMIKDQEYVLSKIRFYQEENKKIKDAAKEYSTLITDLPLPPPTGNIGYL
jgi:hypothetical protein